MYFLPAFVAVLPLWGKHSGQQPFGQQGFSAALAFVAGRHWAAHSGVQPGGQAGSSQQQDNLRGLLPGLVAVAGMSHALAISKVKTAPKDHRHRALVIALPSSPGNHGTK
jgi:hypothetical protein